MVTLAILWGVALVVLTGINLADAVIADSKRRVSDDAPCIESELRLNAQIRELQGLRRIGDELTERRPAAERVGAVREVTTKK